MGMLEKFEAEYEKLKDKVADMWAEVASASITKTNVTSVCEGTFDAIVRVGELKDAGRSGNTVDDFLDDKEVKSLHDDLNEHIETIRAADERENDARTIASTLYDDLIDLKGRIESEAKKRKKKLVGKDSESAPEMEKLAKEIDKFVNESNPKLSETLRGFASKKAKAFTYDKQSEKRVNQSIAKEKTDRAEEMAEEMLKQKLNIRLVKGNLSKVKGLSDKVTADLTEALKALKENRPDDSKTAVNDAVKQSDQIQGVIEPLQEAFDKFIKGTFQEDTKDGEAIFKMLADMTTLQNKSLKEVEKIQAIVTARTSTTADT